MTICQAESSCGEGFPLGQCPQSVLARSQGTDAIRRSAPAAPGDLLAGLWPGEGQLLSDTRSLGHVPSAATSDLSTHSTTSLVSNEEQFEDYGEGDDVDGTPSSPCPDDEARTNVYSDLGSSVSSRWPLARGWRVGPRKGGRANPPSPPGVQRAES